MNGSSRTVTTRIDRDAPLVAALRRGDPTAVEDLVATYGDRAWRLATRITGNAQDAEEAVQDALFSVIRKIDSFRGDSAFGSWLYRIVTNAAHEHCRSRRRRLIFAHRSSLSICACNCRRVVRSRLPCAASCTSACLNL